MRVVVTGGLGFIGSSLVRYLVQQTLHHVLVVDSMTYAAVPQSVEEVHSSERYAFERVDIRDLDALTTTVIDYKPDLIMHLAAETHVDRSIGDSSVFMETNILGTYNLLQATRSYCETLKGDSRDTFRLHHVSTDEVYGSLGISDKPFTENSRYDPRSPYSASKSASDHLVRAWGETFRLPVTLSNCSNNYGPWQYPDKLIPVIISRGRDKKPIPIYGMGDNIRDWLHVDDHTEALMRIATEGRIGESYNIGGGAERTNLEVALEICKILDEKFPSSYSHSNLIRFTKDRPGHDFRYAVNSSKLREELDWAPCHNFEDGLRNTVDWYLSNETWWRTIVNKPSANHI